MKLPDTPPPGPFRPTFWRSPLRGPWLTSVLGTLLLPLVLAVGITGLLSHTAYQPDLGGNAIVPRGEDVDLFVFSWPASPSWLYALTQSIHVVVGIVAVPLLLAKLWSVIPRLFAFPPVRSPAQALERLSIAVLVGSALFEFATGIANAQVYYPFKFGFVTAHYYGGLLFLGALTVHVLVKLPTIRRAYATHGALRPLRDDLAHTEPEPFDPDGGLAPERPDPPTLSRRGLLAFVGGASGLLFVSVAGQSLGGPLRKLAFLAPRRESFPVNKTFAGAGLTPEMLDGYALTLVAGDRRFQLSRGELERMEQHTESLPIACVEGWTTTQTWTGVRIADLARLMGMPGAREVTVESLQPRGVLRRATLNRAQLSDERSLLALKVNGEDLPLDHGYPARVIVPAVPGVHNTKWVGQMTFRA